MMEEEIVFRCSRCLGMVVERMSRGGQICVENWGDGREVLVKSGHGNNMSPCSYYD